VVSQHDESHAADVEMQDADAPGSIDATVMMVGLTGANNPVDVAEPNVTSSTPMTAHPATIIGQDSGLTNHTTSGAVQQNAAAEIASQMPPPPPRAPLPQQRAPPRRRVVVAGGDEEDIGLAGVARNAAFRAGNRR